MGDDPNPRLVLLRFSGDISIKARATRFQFVRRLLHNVRAALVSEGIAPRVQLSHNRIVVELPPSASVAPLARVFGVQSISPVELLVPTELGAIVLAGEKLFRDRVRDRRFAVRARRVGNRSRIGVSAGDVERALGAALLPVAAGVDLDSPEVTARLELHEGETYLFSERIPAPGGLPLGVESRAVALVSGGFDSAVAAWQLLKRGVSLDYVFCNLGGATHLRGAARVTQVLVDRWSYGERPRLHAIDFEPLAEELQKRTAQRFWQILLKRLMLRAAEIVAVETRAAAIVTGEAVGQVSSQTLQNLSVISRATSHTILRPLVGYNKDEIIDVARAIGTYDLSKVVREYCALVPRRPATAAALEVVEAEEAKLDPSALEQAVGARTVYGLRGLELEELGGTEHFVDRIPEGATLIDLRSPAEYRSWHHPDALRLDFSQALHAYPSFDRQQTYVLFCDYGLKSAHLAEQMRREGLVAFNFRGGTRALRRSSKDEPRHGL